MKILVSVGTHEQPFQRLLDAVACMITDRPEHEYIVQYGVGSWPVHDSSVTAADYFDAGAMQTAMTWADVLVSQSSPGNVFGAIAAGTWPLVLGRSHTAGEHVDDHQVRFAKALEGLGYATDIRQPSLLASALDSESRTPDEARAARVARAARAVAENSSAFRTDVWHLLGAGSGR